MKPQSCLRPARTALHAPFPGDRAAPVPVEARSHRRLAVPALALLLLPIASQAVFAQQAWPQSPQYQNPSYVQPNPNYVQYQQPQPQSYPQQQSSQQPQYAPQQGYADPGQDDAQPAYAQPQQAGQPFAAEQLEQLVAPIALYPDALVAQILAASTYPAQIIAADNWLHAQGYASPEQIAYGADAQSNWDPSVKALTAFPQVLAMMNQDLRWTTDLGNAYYNQPQDVLQTIQIMRQRAQSAGTLQSTPQEQVSYNQGYIQLAPVNPQVVYVPTYNPWTAYGQPVSPYPGFSWTGLLGTVGSILGNGMRFGSGIGMAAFSGTPYAWAGWLLNWLTSTIFFHQSPYSSQSTSVAHWGNSGGGYYGSQSNGFNNRQPNGFNRPQQGYNHPGNQPYGQGFTRPPVRTQENYGYNQSYNHYGEAPSRGYAGNSGRPGLQNYGYSRPQPQPVLPSRPQTYSRPGPYGYGSGFYSNSQQGYAARPPAPYASPQQPWRGSTYQHNDFAQRAYADPRSYSNGRNYNEAYAKPEHSGGFHMFGGGHGGESYHAPKPPKPPKMSGGGHGGGGGGGGHHSGGGSFGHHGR